MQRKCVKQTIVLKKIFAQKKFEKDALKIVLNIFNPHTFCGYLLRY